MLADLIFILGVGLVFVGIMVAVGRWKRKWAGKPPDDYEPPPRPIDPHLGGGGGF